MPEYSYTVFVCDGDCFLVLVRHGLYVIFIHKRYGGKASLDALKQVVHLSTNFLDNVIDANVYPLQQIHELAQNIRRIGLGVMGWADMMIRLGIGYDSEEGVALGQRVMGFVDEEARRALQFIRGVLK